MKRKLIRQGKTGLTIYVPKKWVDQRNLKPGDEIEIDEVGNQLILGAKGRQRAISINLKGRKHTRELITHAYRAGFDHIELKHANLSLVQDVVDEELLGFEIAHHDKGNIVLENMTEPEKDKFETILRRIFLIIKESHASVMAGQKIDIDRVRKRSDKYVLYCLRQISKNIYADAYPLFHWELLKGLMAVQHAIYYFAKHKGKPSEVKQLSKKFAVAFQKFYQGYFEKNVAKIHEVIAMRDSLHGKDMNALLKKQNDPLSTVYARHSLRMLVLACSPVLAILEGRMLQESQSLSHP